MKKFTLTVVFLATLAVAVFIFASCIAKNDQKLTTHSAVFVVNGETVQTSVVQNGQTLKNPGFGEADYAPFAIWTYNGREYDFTTPVTADIVLTAAFDKVFKVDFVAGDHIVKTCEYNYYSREVNEPAVPVKDGYSGVWENYTTDGGNKTVKAIYTPVVYNIDFYSEGHLIKSIACTVENYSKLLPDVPLKIGYNGRWIYEGEIDGRHLVKAEYQALLYTVNAYIDGELVASESVTVNDEIILPKIPEREHYEGKWSEPVKSGEYYEVHAIYYPKVYKVSFVSNGVTVGECEYTIENKNIIEPSPIAKPHYRAVWEDYELCGGNFIVNSILIPLIYTITFVADGITVEKNFYDIENTEVVSPPVPEKEGFSGAWEAFTPDGGDITVNAVYTPQEYKIIFMADGMIAAEIPYSSADASVVLPKVPAKRGYDGVWESFTLNCKDITVNAIYTPSVYMITFLADGKVVSQIQYTIDDGEITPPDIPEKEGYTAVWESFNTDLEDLSVNAVYIPVKYYAEFYADGKPVAVITFTVESLPELPEVPEKTGYIAEWEKFEFKAQDLKVNAVYIPRKYTVTFIANGRVAGIAEYTVENKDIITPEVPLKEGYTGVWEKYELTTGHITVCALYSPVRYVAQFIADGVTVGEISFTFEDTELSLPEVPAKQGYTGRWEEFSIKAENLKIQAVYTPIEYEITFIAEEKIIAVIKYNVENTEIIPPAVPQKTGFAGNWEEFSLTYGNIIINAVYTPAQYKILFVADGTTVKEIGFTVEDTNIELPPVPAKKGYYGEWEDFEPIYCDLTVNAIYTPIKYSLRFICDGTVIYQTYYTVEDKTHTPPAMPEKDGYACRWEEYELDAENVDVNAVFDPITYFIYFTVDNVVIYTAEYTVENKNVSLPAVPEKHGFIAIWEDFVLTFGNIVVRAEYIPIDGTEGLIYTLNEDRTSYTVTGYKGISAHILIPAIHNGLPVTGIGSSAFAECTEYNCTFEDITICEGVQSIGDNAFEGCEGLKTVILPKGLKTIGQSAFANCGDLTYLEIPDSVTEIAESAFSNSGLVNIKLPKGLEIIMECLFFGCINLKEIVIPDGVKEILPLAFANCNNLEKIVFGTGLNKIHAHAFINCEKLESAIFQDNKLWQIDAEDGRLDVTDMLSDASVAADLIKNYSAYEFHVAVK